MAAGIKARTANIAYFVLNCLKLLPDNSLFMATEYMERILRRKFNPGMEPLVEKFGAKRFETRDQKDLKTIVQEFIVLAEER
jgi:hypothetical protein